ncbi:MAG: hypothetical protein IT166_07430 [Bryobacterales bacterium]|nr:hypothetical protein [Bryobacterales bacterium]
MTSAELLRQIGETLGETANARTVFGEPIHHGGRTVVPVARVSYGFGGGFGSQGEAQRAGEGGGGGGGVRAYPAGALEISGEGTRFIQFPRFRWLAAAFGAGLAIGALIAWKRGRT